jgi:hypothetical protein
LARISQAAASRSRLIKAHRRPAQRNPILLKHLFYFHYLKKHQECDEQCVITAGAENVLYVLDDTHPPFSMWFATVEESTT